MERKEFSRRDFVKGSCTALALSAIPGSAVFGQALSKRLDWDTFRKTSYYAAFVRGIGAMRDNTDPTDRRSWTYWINAHLNYCPHGIPYFLAWHRGYLYYFEQYLRLVSGNSSLMVPYWDYYKNPVIPAEFTDPAPSNPLYVPTVNTNVSQALTLAPFSPTLLNFPRGTINSFEPSVERKPHDPVHDIIGAVMTTMRSPENPIFWLHHANIDRLWVAWVAAGGGRQMPASNSSYWAGQFTYGPGLMMSRNLTINNRGPMQYFYENEQFPASLPNAITTAQAKIVAEPTPSNSTSVQNSVERPPLATLESSAQRPTDTTRLSVGGARNIRLGDASVSARVAIDKASVKALSDAVAATQAVDGGAPARGAPAPDTALPGATIQVVLDDVRLSAAGEKGGYFYNVYLNMPAVSNLSTLDERYLLGSVGSFAVLSALHHAAQHNDHAQRSQSPQSGAARLVFPATRLLASLPTSDFKDVTVSFVRVSGDSTPKGVLVTIGELRLEVSDDDLE